MDVKFSAQTPDSINFRNSACSNLFLYPFVWKGHRYTTTELAKKSRQVLLVVPPVMHQVAGALQKMLEHDSGKMTHVDVMTTTDSLDQVNIQRYGVVITMFPQQSQQLDYARSLTNVVTCDVPMIPNMYSNPDISYINNGIRMTNRLNNQINFPDMICRVKRKYQGDAKYYDNDQETLNDIGICYVTSQITSKIVQFL